MIQELAMERIKLHLRMYLLMWRQVFLAECLVVMAQRAELE